MIQSEVLKAFEDEKIRAQAPGYVSRYDDYDLEFESDEIPASPAVRRAPEPQIVPVVVDDAEPVRPPHRMVRPEESHPNPIPQSEGGFGAGIFE